MDVQESDGQETEEAAPPPEVVRGRQQTVATLVTLSGSFVLVTFLGGAPALGLVTWLVVLGLLGMQMFRGVAWARYVLGALTVLLSIGNGYRAVLSWGADGIGWAINGGLTFMYAWCAFMLVMSPAIKAFTDAQRANREAALRAPSE